MNNSILDIFVNNERKQYKKIIKLIEDKHYILLFKEDNDKRFGLTNQKYIDKILTKIEQEVINNPEFIFDMHRFNYHRANYFNEVAIKSNPEIVETFIKKNIEGIGRLIHIALENGYVPSNDYINNHIQYFSDENLMLKLIDQGYKPTDEIIEQKNLLFANEELCTKILKLGYKPSKHFLFGVNFFKYPNLVDVLIDFITPEIIGNQFYGCALAQRKIISKRPDLLLSINQNNIEYYQQFWIEAIKLDCIPLEKLKYHYVNTDFMIFSRIVKRYPEMVTYSRVDDEKSKQIDELALSMGYIPSFSDAQNNKYIQNSFILMKSLILRRPEAIIYYKCMEPENEFFDLVRLALDNGYIPSEKDLKVNSLLTNSFDVMRILIQENPELINEIGNKIPKKEELLKIAIKNGFDGIINKYPKIKDPYDLDSQNPLLLTETAIIYRLGKGEPLDSSLKYGNKYSIKLYNYLINNGYQLSDIINLFTGNFETMLEIISTKPEYVTFLSKNLSRDEIDKLCLIAIEKGYEPKLDDEIFGYGSEINKIIVKKYPSYLKKVYPSINLVTGREGIPRNVWLEICKISIGAGFMPNVGMMSNGYDNINSELIGYNSCYEIMKKAIPLAPYLIESCNVEDKEQYDELCKLAISCGYEIEDKSPFIRYKSKMCTNYDLMSKFIVKYPDFLPEVEITNSDEMLKLIEIAINSGLKLSHLSLNKLYKLFLFVDEEKWDDYLDYNTILRLQKIKKLQVNNAEIYKTIDSRFLSDELVSHFTKEQIEILSCYPTLQKKILKLRPEGWRRKIIYKLIGKYKDNLEWINLLEKALDNIYSSEYTNLLESITNKELSEDEVENLLNLLITDNYLDITTFEELKNIELIRENYIKWLIEKNTLGSLKIVYFIKKMGIDLSTAINLVKIYGKSLENISFDSLDEQSKSEFIILKNIEKIINLNDIETIKYYIKNINQDFIVRPDLMITYESRLKNLFVQEFNKSFTKPLEEDKVISSLDGEKDLDIYLAAGHDGKKKCRMMITSIGAYGNIEEPDDYYSSWNMPIIKSHGCCCSYIGEKNLGVAKVRYCCFGFTDYEPGSLLLSAPYDLCSRYKKEDYQISGKFSSMFLLPDDVLDYTRHTHNEIVWERRNISGNVMFKKQPSYIVFVVDNFEDRLTNLEAMRQWENVKKAASNFSVNINGIKSPLPIMVVEREKIAKSQLEIIQSKLSEFKTNLNPNLITKIISDYESNYSGNRMNFNISKKYFPKYELLSDSVVGKIIEIIDNAETNIAIQCVYELEKAVKSEQEKYDNCRHGILQSTPSFDIEDAMININMLKSKFRKSMDSAFVLVNNCEEKHKEIEKNVVPKL